ncbi:integrase catalytic domain-containing protein [Arthrobacter sp. MMS24-S77]
MLDELVELTGWTVNRCVPNKAQKHVFAALRHVLAVFPFPVIGIDSDNGSEFINNELFEFCLKHRITFTWSRPSNKNDAKIRSAGLSRQILALTGRLEAIATGKQPAPIKPVVNERWIHTSRRFSHEATYQRSEVLTWGNRVHRASTILAEKFCQFSGSFVRRGLPRAINVGGP